MRVTLARVDGRYVGTVARAASDGTRMIVFNTHNLIVFVAEAGGFDGLFPHTAFG
jgi:hypothetical protein